MKITYKKIIFSMGGISRTGPSIDYVEYTGGTDPKYCT